MTETQQRFLRAIAERVPMHQVVELHLFPPIRQGGVETGVAVVAEDPRPRAPNVEPVEAEVAEPVLVFDAEIPVLVDQVEPPEIVAEVEAEAVVEASDVEVVAAEAYEADEDLELVSEAVEVDEDDDESPYADDEAGDEAEADADVIADTSTAEQGDVAAPAPVARYTIHTARYRLTLKGVDRGKWEVDVVAEADAPLEAVDAVVRGVQRRAGEGAEPDRLNAEAFRGALEAPLATLER